jgi:outer membrane protein assembly factor BamB
MFKSLLSLLLFIHCTSLVFAQSQWRIEKKWAFKTGSYVQSSPAIGSDGTIYVGSYDDNLHAINPRGRKKWAFDTGDSVFSSPAIGSDGTIYVGSITEPFGLPLLFPEPLLYAINPDGSKKWAFDTGGAVDSSPAIGSDGTIYVGCHGSYLYAINPDGSKKWAFETGDIVDSSPAIGTDGTIYFGSWDDNLYAINPDGSKKWEFETGSIVGSPAIGSDGTVYVGSYDDNLHAINPDGSKKWAFKTGDNVGSSPAIGRDGTIYVGSGDKNLYAINPDGSKKWAFETGDSVFSSPAIGSDGTIYFGSQDNNLYAINPDGSKKWAFKTGRDVDSSPAIGRDGTIYFGSDDGNLYAISEFEINVFDQSISKGQSLTLKYFTQPTFTYQWFYNAKEIPGATSISYTIENADLEDSGTYKLAIMDQTGKVRLYKSAVITVTPDSVEEKDKEDQLKIEINENGGRLLTFNPKDGKANWQIDFSGDLQDWKNLGKLDTNKAITDSRNSAEILLEQHTAKHGGFGIRTWSAEKGNLKSFDETKGQYEFLSPAEFAERFGLDYPIKQFYRARLVE